MKRTPKYLAEALGTFCLVFAGTAAIAAGAGGKLGALEISLVFGLVVAAMVYTLGHISGAHLNPAVTLAFWSAGRLSRDEVLPYWFGQLAGAVCASALVAATFGAEAVKLGTTSPAGGLGPAFIMELVLTFILMFVIMAVATDTRAAGTMAGVAIGATVCLGALTGGPVSGASMNPARTFGPALLSLDFGAHWLYWAGPMLGAVAGAKAYALLQCDGEAGPGKGCC